MDLMRSWLRHLAVIGVAWAVLSGCVPGTSPAAPVPTSSPQATVTPLPANFPDGVYAIDTYKLKFQAGRYTLLTEFDQEWAGGRFVVERHRILITENSFAPECGAADSPFSYEWSFDGKALRFSNPDDKCTSRHDLMTQNPWVLKTQ